MSIALMTLAWKTDLPSGRKMVLLALCDNANDQGDCYPSINTIAQKCTMGERTVQQHIADLQRTGFVERKMRNGRSTLYKIEPRRFCTPAESAPPQISHPFSVVSGVQEGQNGQSTPADSAPPQISHPFSVHSDVLPPQNSHLTPADSAPPPPQNLHPTPADFAPITIKETSVEPSKKRQVARGSRLPSDWKLLGKHAKAASEIEPQWTEAEIRMIGDKFRDHWIAVPGQKGCKSDWDATWRNWCRNEQQRGNVAKPASHGAWFASEQSVAAKGAEFGLKAYPGESAFTFKARVQAVIDNGGVVPIIVSGQTVTSKPPVVPEPKAQVSPENRKAALDAARNMKSKRFDGLAP